MFVIMWLYRKMTNESIPISKLCIIQDSKRKAELLLLMDVYIQREKETRFNFESSSRAAVGAG